MSRWSAEQVGALAPDAGSLAAARKVAGAGGWAGTGADDASVWGEAPGSGQRPYRVVVDLSGPAYKCSCPSRKFPCKHALGLLLRWSAGQVGDGTAPGWVTEWLTAREAKAPARKRTATVGPKREARVAAGLEDLDRWLLDQVRNGIGAIRAGGYRYVEPMAARMVDAQAPGVAGALRRLPGVAAGRADWTGALLSELALLRLTVTGHRALDTLPPGLAACVRREVGYPVAKEDVLAGPPVADRWAVVGRRDDDQERVSSRRVWLRGTATGRPALVLSFAAAGASLDASLVPGTVVDADLHFYPGTAPLRALVGARRGEPVPVEALAGGSLADAAVAYAGVVAQDPWTGGWPVVVAGLTPGPGGVGVDVTGRRVRLLTGEPWRLLAVSGGRPVTVAGEYTPAGLRLLSVLDPEQQRLVTL